MSSKLIGLVITNLAGSGAEKIVLQQFNMFEKFGHKCYIFLLEDVVSYNLTKEEKERIIVLSKNRKYYKLFSNFGDSILSNLLEKKMKDIEKKESKNFDLILSSSPSADRVCFYSKRNNIFNVIHNSYQNEINEFKKRNMTKRALKKEKLYKRIYYKRNLITVSKKIISDLKELGIDFKSIDYIYNPFDFKLLQDKSIEKIELDYEYIINASAFRFAKRHDILLDAYKKSGLKYKLVLLCNENEKLLKLIKDRNLQDKVEILGFQKNPYPFIKNAKFLVLSSEREGLPTVLIESLILGTPVVSTNCVSGPDEILTDELAKYLAKVNDSDDLADKMKLLDSDGITITNKYIEKFSEENIVNKYLNLIKE